MGVDAPGLLLVPGGTGQTARRRGGRGRRGGRSPRARGAPWEQPGGRARSVLALSGPAHRGLSSRVPENGFENDPPAAGCAAGGPPMVFQFDLSGKPGIALVLAPVGVIANHLPLMPWPL